MFLNNLTHLPLLSHICVSESSQHWFRYWLVANSAPSHYLNQYWVIVSWTLRNKLQWNFDQNTKTFIREITSQIIVCEMAVILSRWDELKGKRGKQNKLKFWSSEITSQIIVCEMVVILSRWDELKGKRGKHNKLKYWSSYLYHPNGHAQW